MKMQMLHDNNEMGVFCVKVTQKPFEQRLLKMLICSVARSTRDMTEKWRKGDVLIFKIHK